MVFYFFWSIILKKYFQAAPSLHNSLVSFRANSISGTDFSLQTLKTALRLKPGIDNSLIIRKAKSCQG